jgi:predicted DNA-binding transcriptional regulator YafY
MNRTDRLLAIVLELQAKGWQRAEDLAATFEITKRTIYRDMLALLEAGVPVVSIPGQGYSLVEGYFLPPLSFSTDEALMLILGADLMAQNIDAQYHLAAQTASHKIQAVLPESLREDVSTLQESIRFITSSPTQEAQKPLVQLCRRAIIQRRTIQFIYNARFSQGEVVTTRSADPYALLCVNQIWYLNAFCHLRNEPRHFRLDRMEQCQVTGVTFSRPATLKIGPSPQEDRNIEVRVLFDHETVRWMREAPSFFKTGEEDHPDGVVVTLLVRREDELLQWLLGWGAGAQVLAPESLRLRVREAIEAMLARYAEPMKQGV